MRLQKREMLEHRMVGRETDLAGDGDRLGLGLDAVKLDAVVGLA